MTTAATSTAAIDTPMDSVSTTAVTDDTAIIAAFDSRVAALIDSTCRQYPYSHNDLTVTKLDMGAYKMGASDLGRFIATFPHYERDITDVRCTCYSSSCRCNDDKHRFAAADVRMYMINAFLATFRPSGRNVQQLTFKIVTSAKDISATEWTTIMNNTNERFYGGFIGDLESLKDKLGVVVADVALVGEIITITTAYECTQDQINWIYYAVRSFHLPSRPLRLGTFRSWPYQHRENIRDISLDIVPA